MVIRIHLMSGCEQVHGQGSCAKNCGEHCKKSLIGVISDESNKNNDDPCTCYRNLGQCKNDAHCPHG